MSDSANDGDAARMELEPTAVHQGEEEPYVDCPQCGSPVTFTQIVEEGHCTGHLDADVAEVEAEGGEQIQQPDCTADLSLELVWSD